MNQQISFNVNNDGVLALNQQEHDEPVTVGTYWENGESREFTVSAGDFVMLMNYYRYQKENGKPIL
jgi:co-chaperonin GroES (HSP10)